MNLTGRPPYQKGSMKKKSRRATAQDRQYWEEVRQCGCILRYMGINHECKGPITIHHCGTGSGGRKDHAKVVPLCFEAHVGRTGIDGRVMSKKVWQEVFATEEDMLAALHTMMGVS